MSITVQERAYTPASAQALLDISDIAQRNVSYAHVAYLAAQMEGGHWDSQANPISIDRGGKLINGQHRMLAVIKADMPVKILTLKGQKTESFHVMDTGGKARTADDMAVIAGQPGPVKLLVGLFRWQNNLNVTGTPTVTPVPQKRKSEWEIQDWGYKTHGEGLSTSHCKIKAMGKQVPYMPHKFLVFCHYNMTKNYAAGSPLHVIADDFIEYLLYGISEGNTAYCATLHLLREKMIEKYTEMKAAGTQPRPIAEAIIPMVSHGWWCLTMGYTTRARNLNQPSDMAPSYFK